MIGIVIRETTFLRVLQPIIEKMTEQKIKYNLYLYDAPRGEKEYMRASINNINKYSSKTISGANKIVKFNNDSVLSKALISDGIKKLVSVEIYLWAKKYTDTLNKNNIRLYSISYLSDNIRDDDIRCINSLYRTYYTSKYIMSFQNSFLKSIPNTIRDKCFGSPLFDQITTEKNNSDVLVLFPNISEADLKPSFGSRNNLIKIFEKMYSDLGNKLIIKTKKKIWFPKEIKQYAKEIVYDQNMYPSITTELYKKTGMTIMFYSSGVFESVYAGNYVVNVEIPVNRWSNLNVKKVKKYFDGLYNYSGVIETIPQSDILNNKYTFSSRFIDENIRKVWVKNFISDNNENSCDIILSDILQ